MLPLDKVERIELAPDFEIIYDREKVTNILAVSMGLPECRNSSYVYLSTICLTDRQTYKYIREPVTFISQ
jgi:hypothetical protein